MSLDKRENNEIKSRTAFWRVALNNASLNESLKHTKEFLQSIWRINDTNAEIIVEIVVFMQRCSAEKIKFPNWNRSGLNIRNFCYSYVDENIAYLFEIESLLT